MKIFVSFCSSFLMVQLDRHFARKRELYRFFMEIQEIEYFRAAK